MQLGRQTSSVTPAAAPWERSFRRLRGPALNNADAVARIRPRPTNRAAPSAAAAPTQFTPDPWGAGVGIAAASPPATIVDTAISADVATHTATSPPGALPLDPPIAVSPVLPAFHWLTRPRRILIALAAMWVLNIFDLGFTIAESVHGHFVEVNPIAARLLGGPVWLLASYKFSLITFGTVILLSLRKHRIAEWGAWFLFATYLYVGVRWFVYYEGLYTETVHPVHAVLAWMP